ncbi:MAG TPA: hypothetical protein VIY48_19945 [Candidatus Paceibacterota bacterium]
MTSVVLGDRIKVNTATTGTGTVTLGSASSNAFCTFAEGGISDGNTVAYCIEDSTDFEIGTGVYTAAGTTMTRAAVLLSKISGTAGTTKLTLSGSATVRVVAVAEHIYYDGRGAGSTWSPTTSDGAALGTGTKMWSDLFLADGAVVNFNNGNVTLTHSSGLITSSAALSLGTSNAFTCGTVELGAASDTTLSRSAAGVLAVEGAAVVMGTVGATDNALVTANGTGTHTVQGSVGGATLDDSNNLNLGTSAALTTGTIELGAASDTTLTRSAAGRVKIEGNEVLSGMEDQYATYTEKTTLTSTDMFLVENSADYNSKAMVQHGTIAPYIFHNLPTDMAGQNVNTAQSWFPDSASDGVTVAANTTYRFAGLLFITRSAGTTSHTTSIGFGGTATIASFSAFASCKTGDTTASASVSSVIMADATSIVVKGASTSATEQIMVVVEGTLRIGTAGGGTIIPQFTYSAAPGGIPTIKANSFFELARIGTDLVTSAGTWS